MRPFNTPLKKLTVVSVAGFLLILTVAAKVVSMYAMHHPQKEQMHSFAGTVRRVKLGGNGSSTYFHIERDGRTNRYSSYYGKVWPGMERIREGDAVHVLAERNKLNRNELVTGKEYYLWELVHQDRVIVTYDDIRALVQGKEAELDGYINGILQITILLVIFAYVRQLYLKNQERNSSP